MLLLLFNICGKKKIVTLEKVTQRGIQGAICLGLVSVVNDKAFGALAEY